MLDHGADIRTIQMPLGHSSLSTAQIYQRISIPKLKKIHAKYDPRGE